MLILARPDERLAAPVEATIHAEAVPGLVCLGTHGGALQVHAGSCETRKTCLFVLWSSKW